MEHAYWPLRVRETDPAGGRATANVLLGKVSPPGRPHFTWPKAPALRLARTPRHLPHLDEELLEIAHHRRVALRQRCRDAVPQREQILQALSAVRVLRLVRHLADPVEETAAVSYTHLRAHETRHDLVCRLLLE